MNIKVSEQEMLIKTLLLDRAELCIKRKIPAFAGRMRVEVLKDFSHEFCEEISVELICYIASHESEVKVPATWWEHFKQTYFTPRILKWWPVKYQSITCRVLLPDFPFKDEDLPRKVIHYIPRR